MEGEDEDEASAQMIDEIHANGGDEAQRHRPITNGEQLDVEAYASLYSGRTKVTRLLFIADRCGVVSMQLESLRMAYDEAKKGENTQLFREIVQKIDGRLGPSYGPDKVWADSMDRRAELRKEKLENELNAYRTNLIKESIRMGYNDFGDFFYAHGALGDAFKNYVRTRDYCTTSNHILYMCLNAILVSIEMGQFTNVSSYVAKAEQTPDALGPVSVAKLCAAAGLALLEAKKYKLAARKFLETGHELGNRYSEVIALQDIATYGGLCVLASFDRTELKNKVIDNLNFRNFLELVPEVRELIHNFYSSHYASCLDYLGNLKANLLLDIHLHDHVETLYEEIRHKALIQYTHPFVSVDLGMMANAFKTSVAGLEKELEALITDNQIQERCGGESCFIVRNYPSLSKHSTPGSPEILIRGVTGVELLAGLHWYIKHWCGAHVSWDKTGGVQLSSVPKPGSLPRVQDSGILIQRPIPWHYYQNAVTSSYTFAWWDWERWEKEIDWMALQGINLPLAFTGQEASWQKVFQNFNISSSDLNDFFGGPAFLAWARMENLHGWGGPLPQTWLDQQLTLQKKILARMFEFGMTPVLPAFSGNVPAALTTIFPSASITRLANWFTVGGDSRWCCTFLLDATDPLFVELEKHSFKNNQENMGGPATSTTGSSALWPSGYRENTFG